MQAICTRSLTFTTNQEHNAMKLRQKQVVAAIMLFSTYVVHAQEVVKIGHVAPISGPQGHNGKDNENGARMAVDELNQKGVVIGGKRVRLELRAEDDAADPKQGTGVAQKFCDEKVNGVVGHLNSGTTIPASAVYNQCGIPHITPSATNPKLTQQGFKTTFRLLANDNALGAGVAAYAAETLSLKKVVVIDDRTAYGQGVAQVFKTTAAAKGIQIVGHEYTNDKATDFMSVLTSVKAKAPDAIFYGGMDAQGGPMLRQMAQLGMSKVRFFGGDGICTTKLAELAGGAKTLSNVICAQSGGPLEEMAGGKTWKAEYDKRYPNQFQVFSPYSYDAVHVLVAAMQAAGSADPKVYLPKLSAIEYQGLTSNVAFDATGELKNPAMTLYTYSDGKKVPLTK
jgi:branched-chain amino acid transport system substrate-binding protein